MIARPRPAGRPAGLSKLACALALAASLAAPSSPTQAPARPGDEYLYLFTYFDTDGFAPASSRQEGNLSGNHDSFDPSALPAGRRAAVETLRHGSVVFLMPKTEGEQKNLISCRGQKVPVRTRNTFNVLFVLGIGLSDDPEGWIGFEHEDGTTSRAPFGLTRMSRSTEKRPLSPSPTTSPARRTAAHRERAACGSRACRSRSRSASPRSRFPTCRRPR